MTIINFNLYIYIKIFILFVVYILKFLYRLHIFKIRTLFLKQCIVILYISVNQDTP